MNLPVIIYYSRHIGKDFEITCFFLDISKSFIEVWHKGSILEPLLSLIYINNISDNLVSNPKLVSEGTSLFSVIQDGFPSKIPMRRFD